MGGSLGAFGVDWGFVGAVAAIVAFLTGCVFWFEQRERVVLHRALDLPRDRERIRADLATSKSFDRYRAGIADLNSEFDRWFGTATSYKAFDRCLLISFFYPLFLFVLAWLLGGSGNIAEFSILPETVESVGRFLRAILLFALLGGIAIYYFFQMSIFFYFGVVILLGGALLFAFDDMAMGAVLVAAVFLATASSLSLRFPFSGIVSIVAYLFIMVGSVSWSERAASIPAVGVWEQVGLFVVLLPLLNATFDWLSWMATRFFLRRAARVPDGWKGVGLLSAELLGDILIGVACLVGLAVALPNTIEFANVFLFAPGAPRVDWLAYLRVATDAPLTAGSLVTGMLVTTLLPTAIHVYCGLATAFYAFAPRAEMAVKLIPRGNARWLSEIDKAKVVSTLIWRRLWQIPALAVAGTLLMFLTTLAYLFFKPIGLTLADIAICTTGWSHDLGCSLF